ncbi:damage-control phosphatase ARMT1 family protein [Lacrimispora sp.]|uniref:damage-control phosphatase ARMT1 family protein n=1 Tax=Lacrimispora sp. TaxID=2719234 RepID=UPI00289F754A|nr:ARMT1-like domain-containing protein [Lacrimispora sp.]
MRLHDKCLPCVVNQVIRVANITGINTKEELLREVFTYLSKMNFEETTPEIIGEIFDMIKRHANNPDPYKETRNYYNTLFLELSPEFERKIEQAENSFMLAIRYAIVGNIIDFNPIHNTLLEDIYDCFEKMEQLELAIDDSHALMKDISNAGTLLYLGDNCGEICMDKILLKKIKELNPNIKLLFGVRGKPVVNDSISEDAYSVGIDEYAEIVDNGDGSLGTVLNRTSPAFKEVYNKADVVIAKGQANYECLSEENKNIYFLLMTKCDVIANDIGAEEKKMICMKNKAWKNQLT